MTQNKQFEADYFAGRKGRSKPYLREKNTFYLYEKEIVKYVDLSGQRILDVACALGGFVSLCQKKGAYAIGLDISLYALQQAFKENEEQYIQANGMEGLPLGNQTIDILTAFDLIEHLGDPKPLLTEIHRIVKPKGWLFLSTPNSMSFKRPILGEKWNYDETHVRFFKASDLKMLLNQFSFEVVQVICFTESRFKLLEVLFSIFNKAQLGDYLLVIAQRR